MKSAWLTPPARNSLKLSHVDEVLHVEPSWAPEVRLGGNMPRPPVGE